MVAAHVAPRALHVARLGHDLEALFAVEQHAQAAAHHRVVVGQHDLDGTGAGGLGAARAVRSGLGAAGTRPCWRLLRFPLTLVHPLLWTVARGDDAC